MCWSSGVEQINFFLEKFPHSAHVCDKRESQAQPFSAFSLKHPSSHFYQTAWIPSVESEGAWSTTWVISIQKCHLLFIGL